MSACTGSCCVAFPLSKPLAYIAADADRIPDAPTLLDMLEPISFEEACARWDRFADGYRPPPEPREEYFRCNRWDEETRLCIRYDDRPHMCRAYPYSDSGKNCEHGCGLDCDTAPRVWMGD
jgi:Fe-S-cluster containining protein